MGKRRRIFRRCAGTGVFLLALGCDKARSPHDASGTGSSSGTPSSAGGGPGTDAGAPALDAAGAAPGTAGSGSSTNPEALVPNGWELPFLLHYVGINLTELVYEIAVDDVNVYWRAADLNYWSLPKTGGEPELLVGCSTCEPTPEPDGRGLVYLLDGTELVAVDRDTKEITLTELPHGHAGGGAILPAGDFVYTALPGCAALLRIDKSTGTIDVAYIDGVAYPGRGATGGGAPAETGAPPGAGHRERSPPARQPARHRASPARVCLPSSGRATPRG